jgi:hypothetical protein
MNAFTSVKWVNNLYEVGTPIRRTAADIEARETEATERLAKAKQAYWAEIQQFKKDKEALVREVNKFWTQQEIDAAKRGFCLVDGKEIKL